MDANMAGIHNKLRFSSAGHCVLNRLSSFLSDLIQGHVSGVKPGEDPNSPVTESSSRPHKFYGSRIHIRTEKAHLKHVSGRVLELKVYQKLMHSTVGDLNVQPLNPYAIPPPLLYCSLRMLTEGILNDWKHTVHNPVIISCLVQR